MTKKSLFGLLIVAVAITLACAFLPTPDPGQPPIARGHTPVPTATASPSPTQISKEAACQGRLSRILETDGTDVPLNINSPVHTLVTYPLYGDLLPEPEFATVPQDLVSYQQDLAGQKQVWTLFTQLIPFDLRTQVTYFVVITDGQYGLRGRVMQTDDNPHFWRLEVDIADMGTFADRSSVLIHEFGHLLTLNDTQVVPDQQVFDHPDDEQVYYNAISSCKNYFVSGGCSKANSYINQFARRFWIAMLPEWSAALEKHELYAFYEKYSDRFVSPYAVSQPEEDIAETWSHFIFAPRPEGNTIADQKVLFFYEYPDLVTLRTWIVSHLCTYSEQQP